MLRSSGIRAYKQSIDHDNRDMRWKWVIEELYFERLFIMSRETLESVVVEKWFILDMNGNSKYFWLKIQSISDNNNSNNNSIIYESLV